MKKKIKANFKIIITIVITSIICISTTVYASYKYFAKDIGFTPKNENWQVDNLEDAVNDLYENKENNLVCNSYYTKEFVSSDEGNFYSKEIKIPTNVKKVYLNTIISTTYGSYGTSINFDDSLVQKEINTFCANAIICNVIEDYIVNVENQKNIKIDFPVNGSGKHFGYVRVCY